MAEIEVTVPKEGDQTLSWTWKSFYTTLASVSRALTLSGTTANRPTTFLWVGRPYFDITIQRPIWVRDISPTVWITADGVVV